MEVSIESPGDSRISPKAFHLTRMPAVSVIQIPHEVARRLAVAGPNGKGIQPANHVPDLH